MVSKVLELDIKGRASPFAYQMPEAAFRRFQYLEGQLILDPKVPDYIEEWIDTNL